MHNFRQKLLSALRVLPFAVLLAITAYYLFELKSFSAEDILQYTPQNLYFAALVMLGIFAVKSITVFIPLTVLYLACGIIFPTPAAIFISAIGLLISLTLPYFLGFLLGSKAVNLLLTKYEKTHELKRLRLKNEWLFAYILRAVKILPSDLVSMVLGAEKMNYSKYLLGSFAGMFPTLVSTIIMGSSASVPHSAAFIVSTVVTVLFTIVPLFFYPFIIKSERQADSESQQISSVK